MQVGDEVLDLEGHFSSEITEDDALYLAALKRNYLRLGIRRLPMFSNQYMGTRLAARKATQASNSATYYTPATFSSQARSATKPVNSRDAPVDEPDEVDYSFMNLPVRERRKLFIGNQGDRPPRLFPAGVQSMTLPRVRREPRQIATWSDTRSEYGTGDDAFDWEAPVAPTWTPSVRQTPSMGSQKKSSTGTIILNPAGLAQPYTQIPFTKRPNYPSRQPPANVIVTPISPSRSFPASQLNAQGKVISPHTYSTTIRVHDPYSNEPEVRIQPTAATRVYLSGRNLSASPTQQMNHIRSVSDTGMTKAGTFLGRISQPLRINVYNSDGSSARFSPVTRAESSLGVSSPIYPAYPAYYDQPPTVLEERYRRGQSVQPVIFHTKSTPMVNEKVEVSQQWRPLQAPQWVKSERTPSRGRYVAANKPANLQQRQQDQAGVSDF